MLPAKALVPAMGVLSGTLACSSPPPNGRPLVVATHEIDGTTRTVFDALAPAVVAILNDDHEEREQLTRPPGNAREAKTPLHVVDVSLRKDPTPHGTGFVVDGGLVVTAAHVISRPDRLKITSRFGQTTAATLVSMDEIRDVAVLRPAEALRGVPAVPLLDRGEVRIGDRVWALGHTGQGLWALSWGISEGIASGIVEMLGAKLLLFDAAVYPGFSGGPVVSRTANGSLAVVGVNHAILFTGGPTPVASISSASSVSELREVVAGRPHPLEAKLAAFAREARASIHADLFLTSALSVHRDTQGQQVAEIRGNASVLPAGENGQVAVPVVAMMFHVPPGRHDVTFELRDPFGDVVDTQVRPLRIGPHQRVSFLHTGFRLRAKASGPYEVVAKLANAVVSRTAVNVLLSGDEDEVVEEETLSGAKDGEPTVEVVVASGGLAQPLVLTGIRAAWTERTYPRRVDFTWFARGSRGWSGTNVAVTAFVLDDQGRVVGRSVGCFRPDVRPEQPWSCLGQGGTPLVKTEGSYDIVFTLNDRPVAMWPMEAVVRRNVDAVPKKPREKSAAAPPLPPPRAETHPAPPPVPKGRLRKK